MNYLAHIYLSGESEKQLVGNFIGDYIKGNKYLQYDEEIAKGILLHRQIDSFTDAHSLHKEAKLYFRSDFGLYSGIVVDLIYDHFLAKNWDSYSTVRLPAFAKRVHAILLSNFTVLPRRVQGFLPFLIQNKRLLSYASIDGIIQSLKIMGNYSSLPQKSEVARSILIENYAEIEANFTAFFADLSDFVIEDQKVPIRKPDLTTGF
ncbi:ACP phosphodiesterase [Draconibacterium sp. IB214405]|uniref:acyl carrier protein phosphodiesterase n=1 Tax=Draconibacterium sp. IB214405 TaxID=3097352 RepID=UPI002A0C0157|nr:ACP phosphodiesterase [Draconibacterium sp. IB214405]MDX8340979.1 ACP phosphodiesterase [Draconibacterium sp. IB214405]